MLPRKKIFLLITDAGGGHRGTANSLKAAIEKRGLPWDVRIVNVYKEMWQKLELAQRLFRFSGEDVYNFILRHNMIVWAALLRKMARGAVKLQFKPAVRDARAFLEREKPDLVLSIMPFVNDVFTEAAEQAGIPVALLISDLMDTRPYMWFTPEICRRAAFVAVGCPEAAAQGREVGGGERLLESGLVIHPKYFEPQALISKEAARARFNLDAGMFTVMILMGGYGSQVIRHFVEQFEAAPRPWQVIACCGRNDGLLAELQSLAPRLKNKLVPVGFSTELQAWMRAADVLVTKPGPASVMEALAMRTPMLLDDFQTMPQEVPNARFIEDNGLGIGVRARSTMFATLAGLAADPEKLRAIRQAMERVNLKDASQAVIGRMQAVLDAAASPASTKM